MLFRKDWRSAKNQRKSNRIFTRKKDITKITTTMWNLRQPNDASEEKRYTRWLCLEVSKAQRKKEINKAGSFIEKSKLTLRQFVSMIYAWSLNASGRMATVMTGLAEETIVDWINFCRDVCVYWTRRNPRIVGGPGHIVQIDETCVSKAKYNRGRRIPARWVFGG